MEMRVHRHQHVKSENQIVNIMKILCRKDDKQQDINQEPSKTFSAHTIQEEDSFSQLLVIKNCFFVVIVFRTN